jgi:hypothetical protein
MNVVCRKMNVLSMRVYSPPTYLISRLIPHIHVQPRAKRRPFVPHSLVIVPLHVLKPFQGRSPSILALSRLCMGMVMLMGGKESIVWAVQTGREGVAPSGMVKWERYTRKFYSIFSLSTTYAIS